MLQCEILQNQTSESIILSAFQEGAVEMREARVRALTLKKRFIQNLVAFKGRNEGSPSKGIDTYYPSRHPRPDTQ